MSAKIKLSLVLICLFTNFIFAAGGILPGTGTSSDPYLIEDIDDFDVFADTASPIDYYAENVHTQLNCNLDLTGRAYIQAVIAPDSQNSYLGIFNGNGHTISNLNITNSTSDYTGLFGRVVNGSVSNLSLSNILIDNPGNDNIGGICGSNSDGLINCCSVSGSIITDFSKVGGICGANIGVIGSSRISNCYSTVTGSSDIGGICGQNGYLYWYYVYDILCGRVVYESFPGIIIDCYSTNHVICKYSPDDSPLYPAPSTISDCFWDKETSGISSSDGGTGLTTAQMQDVNTFLDAGWDFVGESNNGTDEIWVIADYPAFAWQVEWIEVPDCITLTQADAENLIIQFGFNVGDIDFVYDDSIEVGCVVSHTPAAAEVAPMGLLIDMTVSLGPWPLVPDLAGMAQAEAVSTIIDADFTVGNITFVNSDSDPNGIVINQNPNALATLAHGSPVSFVVSLGPWPIVPDLYGLTLTEAEIALNDTNLYFGEIKYDWDSIIPEGSIVNQTPDVGTKLASGDTVNITVSLGIFPGLDGSGSEADPFLIQSMEDFDVFSNQNKHDTDYWAEGVHAKLMCDLDLSGRIYNRAVIAPNTDIYYSGVFDGNGHIINDLIITGSQEKYIGLFGVVLQGTVKNIVLSNLNINITSPDRECVGGVCGYNEEGTVSCCSVSGNILSTSSNNYVGGICGFNVGYSDSSMIKNCYSSAAVSGKYAGGICGRTGAYDSIPIDICLFEYIDYPGYIINCYSTGSVSGDYPGGICGYDVNSSLDFNAEYVENIRNCFWDTDTSGMTDSDGGTGLTTAQMQDINTFLDAGWDFTGETNNGTEDLWHMPYQSIGYPMLLHQRDIPGDLSGSYGVDIADFAAISDSWLDNYNRPDLQTLAQYWLEGTK